MSDHKFTLRLARIVESIASGDGPHWPTEDVRQLIRDLEAAPQSAPERRTITREDNDIAEQRVMEYGVHPATATHIVDELRKVWRLTVEDA